MAVTESRRTRVLLADNRPLVRDAFAALLAPEFDVVATAGDDRGVISQCRRLHPDVVVLAPGLGALAGEIAARLESVSPETQLVVVTDRAGEARRGTSTQLVVVSNAADSEALKRAIRAAVPDGGSEAEPAGAKTKPAAGGDARSKELNLTDRQLEVLTLLAEGRSMKEVATLLHVTPRTVAFHKYRMMDQLHVRSTAELVQFAVRHGVVSG